MYEKLVVVGLGYVGLPTAVVFASKGLRVIGVDIDKQKVKAINEGKCYIHEPGLDALLKCVVSKGLLSATTEGVEAIKESDATIIAVNTPVRNNGSADLFQLMSALKTVRRGLHKGLLVVIESTLPPGTMMNVVKPFLEETGLRSGADFYIAHVPERIAPGKAIEELTNVPRIIGGIDPESTRRAYELYSRINRELYLTDATTAEFVKLIENTFRDLNIAYANFLALVAEKLGIDVYEAIRLANTHLRVNIHIPGAGVGGPCLTKDPHLLLSSIGEVLGSELIKIARRINDYMPIHIVNKVMDIIKREGLGLYNIKVVVLGTAYKGDVDDTRESPAGKIIKELINRGMYVVAYDPYAREFFGAEKANSVEDALRDADIVIIATDHSLFRSLNWAKLGELMRNRVIVDGRRVLEPSKARKLGFKYYGVGYGKS